VIELDLNDLQPTPISTDENTPSLGFRPQVIDLKRTDSSRYEVYELIRLKCSGRHEQKILLDTMQRRTVSFEYVE